MPVITPDAEIRQMPNVIQSQTVYEYLQGFIVKFHHET